MFSRSFSISVCTVVVNHSKKSSSKVYSYGHQMFLSSDQTITHALVFCAQM
jgi:hypothetical protein